MKHLKKNMYPDIIYNDKEDRLYKIMKRTYSNREIDKAGEKLAQYDINDPIIENDIKIISEWRDAHLYGTQKLSQLVDKRSKQIGGKNVLVSRSKKLESIKLKLSLNDSSNLSRMQDIGGCRIIVEDLNKLNAIVQRMSKFHGGFKLIKKTDYVTSPKPTGYRCVHLVYELQDNTNDNYKILLELQCRTKTQHLWATAVETVGLFNKVSLKSNQGDESWKEFFRLVSMLFEYHETKKISFRNYTIRELINAISIHNRKYKCTSKIVGYQLAPKYIEKTPEKEYYLLILNFANATLQIKSYSKSESEQAQQDYAAYEVANDPNINTVLVSANSIKEVTEGYPNYFADTDEFIKLISSLIKQYR